MKKLLNLLFCVLLSLGVNAQSVINDLPKTWTYQTPLGVYLYTLNKDGSVTTEMRNTCYVCSASGRCIVCGGMGVRYIVSDVMICNSCGGTKICKRCYGKGFTIMKSHSQYGATIYVDENGNTQLGGIGVGSTGGYSSSSSGRTYIETIEYIPGFGLDDTVYCSTCGKTTKRHVHVKKYR